MLQVGPHSCHRIRSNVTGVWRHRSERDSFGMEVSEAVQKVLDNNLHIESIKGETEGRSALELGCVGNSDLLAIQFARNGVDLRVDMPVNVARDASLEHLVFQVELDLSFLASTFVEFHPEQKPLRRGTVSALSVGKLLVLRDVDELGHDQILCSQYISLLKLFSDLIGAHRGTCRALSALLWYFAAAASFPGSQS